MSLRTTSHTPAATDTVRRSTPSTAGSPSHGPSIQDAKASLERLENALHVVTKGNKEASMDSIQQRVVSDPGALGALGVVSDAFMRTERHVEDRGETTRTSYVQVPPGSLKPHEVRLALDAVALAKASLARHDTEDGMGRPGADGKIAPTESARANIGARALASSETEELSHEQRKAQMGEQMGAAAITGLENDLLDQVGSRAKMQLTLSRVAGELAALAEGGGRVQVTDIEVGLQRLPDSELPSQLSDAIKNNFPVMKEVVVRRANNWFDTERSPSTEIAPQRMKLLLDGLQEAHKIVAGAGARHGDLKTDDLRGLVRAAWEHQKQPTYKTSEKDEEGWRPDNTWWAHKFVELVAMSCLAPNERPIQREEPIGIGMRTGWVNP